MTNRSPTIFCALDTADLDQACALARQVGPVTGGLKLGLEFFNSFGPQGVTAVRDACPQAALFIDLKFHDIPNTVAGAVRSVSNALKPHYLNVHAIGGLEMMRAAREACDPATKLLAVTILTSMDETGLKETGQKVPVADQVKRLALLARQAGLAGVVCSAHEISMLRAECGPDFTLMVPGIRPAGRDHADQKRVMTPKRAIEEGATHLVIGRPITAEANPAKAAQEILTEMLS